MRGVGTNLVLILFIVYVCAVPELTDLTKNSNFGNSITVFYDSYRGAPISIDEVKFHDKVNNTMWCVNELRPCNPYESRRLDNTCNNLQQPQRGSSHTPFIRLLPPVFGKNYESRPSKSGNELPLPRKVRTTLLPEGRVPDQTFTQLVSYYLVFLTSDITSVQDTVNYVHWRPYCCLPKGKTDPMCAPLKIPNDDPVHRFSDIRCLNFTKPLTFQTFGCVKNDTTPERVNSETPHIDLSNVYGRNEKNSPAKSRLFQGGLLKYEVYNGRVWPPSAKANQTNICFLNEKPHETRCHDMPSESPNALVGINLIAIWYWRHHNLIAAALAKMNPCWKDEKVYQVAKDINIAVNLQIIYYELMPLLLGQDNMVKDGIISPSYEFRDLYDVNEPPSMTLETTYVLRWGHTIQEGIVKMYDPQGRYMKQFPYVNMTLRTGYLAVDNNLDLMTQGSFRQAGAKVDYIVDPDMAQNGLGGHQRATDLTTADVAKARMFGFPPYIKYRELCTGRPYRKFADLYADIDPERVELLAEAYESVEDIDLISGIWLERQIHKGRVPPTFYCVLGDQLLRNVRSDRHWYERPNRPNAFTFSQLLEIRKASMAHLLCDVGDTVTQIQSRAFERISLWNPIRNCQELPKMNLYAWKDDKCF